MYMQLVLILIYQKNVFFSTKAIKKNFYKRILLILKS